MNKKNNADPMKDDVAEDQLGKKFLIVGIGASAGGIKALKEFFSQVKPHSGIAYVVILHLSPEFESRLAEILQSSCAIPVVQIKEERLKVEPDMVYVIPPNRALAMADGHLQLSARESYEERRAPIDIFFRTLAESNDGRGVAVILSGTGSDGSMGMKRIKECGGIVIVQDPKEADYSDMPRSSIAQGLIDFILPVGRMASQIVHYRDQKKQIHIAVKSDAESQEEENEKALKAIFVQLRRKTGHDFSNYKRATVLRRIERRMNVREATDLPFYSKLIETENEEPVLLLKDLLISVTNFFRDKAAFEALEAEIIPKVFAGKNSGDTVRIWVSACATGEEAYSVAMLCAERLNGMSSPPLIQIFATDIDSNALSVAREGFYSNADVADVSPERLRRFFTKEGSGFKIKRELRETILFAKHNIINDPPFSRLDLATCRNLLIYLNKVAQDQVIETFHFSLNPGAYLFLGSSETLDGGTNLYSIINREYCLFQSRAVVSRPTIPLSDIPGIARPALEMKEFIAPLTEYRQTEKISFAGLHQQLLELYAPPSILVNAQYDIIHVSKNAGKYLQISGEPSLNILNAIRPELRLELRGALYSAIQNTVTTHAVNLKTDNAGEEDNIDIIVRPVAGELDTARGFLLVLFQRSADSKERNDGIPVNSGTQPITIQLEEELLNTRTQFRQLAEHYEVQTEEFKASNEELQAINEELRSAAEELETSKEELQSVNEELSTVNQELKIKIEEISQTNNDFKNLINATHIGTIFLDRSFSVNLFTPAACKIFNLKAADYGRPLTDITNRLSNINVTADLEKVMQTLQPAEREVATLDGNTYLMRILPYRTSEDHINGVVVTFIDITARKNAEEALQTSEEQMRAMFNQARAGVVQTDLESNIIMANKRFCELTGYNVEELLGKKISELISEHDLVQTDFLLEELLESGKPFDSEQRYIVKSGEVLWVHNSATIIHDLNNAPRSVLHTVIDISSQKISEQQKDGFIGIASHELKTPITSIKTYAEVLLERFKKNGDVQSEKIISKLDNQVERMVSLIKELLETTHITAGTFSIRKEPFDLYLLLNEVADNMQYTTTRHQLVLKLDKLPIFNGDKNRIEQVLINLVDNAIKYSPDAKDVLISAFVSSGNINVCIKDSGCGLSEKALGSIFNRFYREDNKTNNLSLGLGLFISLEIAKLHGGTITVQSVPGKGSEFCLVLPLNQD